MDDGQQIRNIRPTISTLAPTTKHPPPALQATACRVDWGGGCKDADRHDVNAGTNNKAPTSSSASNCLQGGFGGGGAKMQTGMMTMADRDNNNEQ
jgi:hypothetical protein